MFFWAVLTRWRGSAAGALKGALSQGDASQDKVQCDSFFVAPSGAEGDFDETVCASEDDALKAIEDYQDQVCAGMLQGDADSMFLMERGQTQQTVTSVCKRRYLKAGCLLVP